jgi:predicted nuclease of restriction endonuclease-like RecB superfamily
MLPTELLINRQNGETIIPKRLPINSEICAIATELIACFQKAVGSTQGDLDRQLSELEGDSPDYRVKRGLAHILKSSFCTFEVVSPLEPKELRQRVFTLAAQTVPSHQASEATLETLSIALSKELNHEVLPQQIRVGLYADLQENRILTQFEDPAPEALIHRYNLSQVQGIFYRASQMALNAHRNVLVSTSCYSAI